MGKKSKRTRQRNAKKTAAGAQPAPQRVQQPPAHAPPAQTMMSDEELQVLQADVAWRRAKFLGLTDAIASEEDMYNTARFVAMSDYATSVHNLLFELSHAHKMFRFDATEDYKMAKQLTYSSTEASFIRAVACSLWGSICRFKSEFENSAQLYHKSIQICNEASAWEKDQRFDNSTDVPVHLVFLPILQHWLDQTQLLLEDLRSLALSVSSKDTTVCGRRRAFLGCDECDVCGKTHQEVGLIMLHCCYNCQMAYYCDKNCQAYDWKFGGHKKVCRKRGEFQLGDLAFCVDPHNEIEFGKTVFIVGQGRACVQLLQHQGKAVQGSEDSPDWFVVMANWVVDRTATVSVVHRQNLRRMRSVLWKSGCNQESVKEAVAQLTSPTIAAIILGYEEVSRGTSGESDRQPGDETGAFGPDGEFIPFEVYTGSEAPKDPADAMELFRQASAHFEVLEDMSLRQVWTHLDQDGKQHWESMAAWDQLRYERDLAIWNRRDVAE